MTVKGTLTQYSWYTNNNQSSNADPSLSHLYRIYKIYMTFHCRDFFENMLGKLLF